MKGRRIKIRKRRRVLKNRFIRGGIGALYELCAPSTTPHFSLLTHKVHVLQRFSQHVENIKKERSSERPFLYSHYALATVSPRALQAASASSSG